MEAKACFPANKKWGCRKDLYVGAPQGPAWLPEATPTEIDCEEAGPSKDGGEVSSSIITVSAIY